MQIELQWPDDGSVTDPEFWQPRPWVFPMTPAAVSNVFTSAGLTRDQLASALDSGRWTEADGMVVVEPDDGLLASMAAGPRSRIYQVLARSDLNPYQRVPFSSPSNQLSGWLEESGLSPAVVAKVRALSYPRGNAVCFSDPHVFADLDALSKARLIRCLSRTPSLVLNLWVDRGSDITTLARYWGAAGRERQVRPLLDAASRSQDGSSIPITQLLPRFARNHLYTYPEAGRPHAETPPDCFYTSINFFNDDAPERFADLAGVIAAFKRDFLPVSSPMKFGDVVLLKDADGIPLHAAVFIADGVVFTKNGATEHQPWTLQKLDDMVHNYLITSDPTKSLSIQILRRRKS